MEIGPNFAWSLIFNEKLNCSGQENCHATEKAIAPSTEMLRPVLKNV
jgi:hypothetical protein